MKLAFDPTKWFSERPLLICFAFGALSVLATLHNKFIFSNHIVSSSNMLLLIQNLVTISALWILRRMKVLEFEVSYSSAGDWLCGLAYALSVVCGLWSLFFVNVVMYGALKRCTTIVTWVIEWKFTPSETTMKCLPPLILMMIGTIEASYYDFQFSAAGYTLALLSCLAQGSAYELGRRVARRNKGVCAVLYCNSIVAIAILAVLVLFTGDLKESIAGGGLGGFHKNNLEKVRAAEAFQQVQSDRRVSPVAAVTQANIPLLMGDMVEGEGAVVAPAASTTIKPRKSRMQHYNFLSTAFHLCANAMTCLFMNYFVFLNCFVNSPLAHSVTGNMKVVMTTLIGGIMFGFALDLFGVIGLTMNMISGFWFSAVKLKAKMAAKQREKKDAALASMEGGAGVGCPPPDSNPKLQSREAGGGVGGGSGTFPIRSSSHHLTPQPQSSAAGHQPFGLDAPPRSLTTFGSPTTLARKRSNSAFNLSSAESSHTGGSRPNSAQERT